jgi:hypothetical protein
MEKITPKSPEQEILNPAYNRPNSQVQLDKSKYDSGIILGTLQEYRIPENTEDESLQCPECGSYLQYGATSCACGLNLEDM